jgi:nucleoside-diphosphate-sugar epimerase
MSNNISIQGKKVLVVGGAGFVGSNLCHHILATHNPKQLIIVDNLLSSDISNVPLDERVHFVFGSITDERILKQLPNDIQIVFHLACYHGNQSSIADPIADHDNNTLTSLMLFEHIKDFKQLEKVVYAAAGCAVAEKTYDDPTATPEDAPVSLFHDSPYSISKLIGEMYGNYYMTRYGLPFVKARFQNVYGPREILGAGRWRGTVHSVWRNVIPTFIWKSMHGEALPLDNGGNASRDFIFVGDMVRGLVACAEKGQPGEAYNLASGVETTIGDLAKIINDATGNKTPVAMKPVRDWDRSGRRFGTTEKSKQQLGFEVDINILDGIHQTVEWTSANKARITDAISNHNILFNQFIKL